MHWASALAALLWDDCVISLPASSIDADRVDELSNHDHSSNVAEREPPTVVVGYDERSRSPELMLGFTRGLKQMSCRVADIGLTTEPCLRFAVQTRQADAGVYLTGSGCDPAWIGFDVFRRAGLPADRPFLEQWSHRQQQSISRPSRSGGSSESFAPSSMYEARLSTRFHALRPLHVVVGSSSATFLARLGRLSARLPGRCQPVTLPVRRRDLSDAQDLDVAKIGQLVREQSAHLGMIVDEDASACGFVDERGAWVRPERLQACLVDHLLQDHGPGIVVLSTDVWDELAPQVIRRGGRPLLVAADDRAARLLAEQALLAVGGDHRYWFGGEFPECDAIVTLAHVLQGLSRSDAEFSRVLDQAR